MKLCGKAVDRVRRQVVRESGDLPRGALWSLRGSVENLKEEQVEMREKICREHAKIARALSIKDFLADTWNYRDEIDARGHLNAVIGWCSRSRLEEFVKLGRSLRKHMEGIMGYFKNCLFRRICG